MARTTTKAAVGRGDAGDGVVIRDAGSSVESVILGGVRGLEVLEGLRLSRNLGEHENCILRGISGVRTSVREHEVLILKCRLINHSRIGPIVIIY